MLNKMLTALKDKKHIQTLFLWFTTQNLEYFGFKVMIVEDLEA